MVQQIVKFLVGTFNAYIVDDRKYSCQFQDHHSKAVNHKHLKRKNLLMKEKHLMS